MPLESGEPAAPATRPWGKAPRGLRGRRISQAPGPGLTTEGEGPRGSCSARRKSLSVPSVRRFRRCPTTSNPASEPSFADRHIGPDDDAVATMLKTHRCRLARRAGRQGGARGHPRRAARPTASRRAWTAAASRHRGRGASRAARAGRRQHRRGVDDRAGLLRHADTTGVAAATSWRTRPGTPPTRRISPRSARAGWRRC